LLHVARTEEKMVLLPSAVHILGIWVFFKKISNQREMAEMIPAHSMHSGPVLPGGQCFDQRRKKDGGHH
jgi:hypothetical protein